jgi:hypothetical protein
VRRVGGLDTVRQGSRTWRGHGDGVTFPPKGWEPPWQDNRDREKRLAGIGAGSIAYSGRNSAHGPGLWRQVMCWRAASRPNSRSTCGRSRGGSGAILRSQRRLRLAERSATRLVCARCSGAPRRGWRSGSGLLASFENADPRDREAVGRQPPLEPLQHSGCRGHPSGHAASRNLPAVNVAVLQGLIDAQAAIPQPQRVGRRQLLRPAAMWAMIIGSETLPHGFADGVRGCSPMRRSPVWPSDLPPRDDIRTLQPPKSVVYAGERAALAAAAIPPARPPMVASFAAPAILHGVPCSAYQVIKLAARIYLRPRPAPNARNQRV